MDEATRARFRELADTADELIERVHEALAPGAQHSFMLETRAKVDELGAGLQGMLAGLGEKARATMERTVGRKVTDLQRLASRLPAVAVGKPAKIPPDTGFLETRPPVPVTHPRARGAAPRKAAARPKRAPSAAATRAKPEIQASLQNAAIVKPYSMEERYEPGDVIDHATFGRGRVERVQPRMMHVQFATGVKSLRTG